MRAKQAAVSTYVKLSTEALCDNCPLKSEFTDGEVMPTIDERILSPMGVDFCITDRVKTVGYMTHRPIRTEDIISSFNGCERAVASGSIEAHELICGAVARLQGKGKN